jgi:hypothetical protein
MAGENDVRIRVRAEDDTRQGMGQASDGIKGALEKLGPIAAGAGAAIAGGLAVATAAAAVLKKALDASIERQNVGNLIAAQIGDTSHAAELGKQAGELYARGFGETLQEAGTAVRDVLRSKLLPEDAADDAVRAISEKVLTVAQITEATSTEVSRSVHKMLVTGLAGSAEEALDLITRGVQQGADEAGDLLDTFDEYSIQFKELGLNGKEALGLISQGLANGARDADTVADALKEIAIRAQDGSKASLDAFKALGLNGKQLSQMFSSGGEQARKALDMVIDKTKNIKDPMERNAIAVGLFGTKAEDLQDALFGLDLDTAVQGLGDIDGAADKASKTLHSGLGPALEKIKRQVGQAFADVGDKLAPGVLEYIDTLKEFGREVKEVFDGSAVPGEILESLRKVADDYGPKLKEVLGGVADKVRENKGAFEIMGRVLASDVIPFLGGTLLIGLQLAGGAIEGLITSVGLLVVGFTVAKQQVTEQVTGMAQGVLRQLDIIVTGAAKGFGWIPGIGPKLEAAAADFHRFVTKVNNELSNLRDHDIYIRTHFVGGQGQSRGGEYRTGGIKGAATGGIRDGLVEVGEEGRELVRLPTGSQVYPHANTRQLEAMSAQGAAPRAVEVRITGSGSWWEMIMEAQRDGRLQILATAVV